MADRQDIDLDQMPVSLRNEAGAPFMSGGDGLDRVE